METLEQTHRRVCAERAPLVEPEPRPRDWAWLVALWALYVLVGAL